MNSTLSESYIQALDLTRKFFESDNDNFCENCAKLFEIEDKLSLSAAGKMKFLLCTEDENSEWKQLTKKIATKYHTFLENDDWILLKEDKKVYRGIIAANKFGL